MSFDGVLPWQRNRHNKLLLKNEVGRAKQSTYNLPPINHSYGKPPKRDAEGAKEEEYQDKNIEQPYYSIIQLVTMTWKYHDETKDTEPPRDFLKLNRNCLKERFINAKDISKYRENHQDVKMKIKKGKLGIELDLPSEDFRFGVRNKPSTPINQVLELRYLSEHERSLLEHYAHQKLQKKDKKITIKTNQTHHLRSVILEKQEKEKEARENLNDFKLERFKNIKPKLNTRSVHSVAHLKEEEAAAEQKNESQVL